jgi:neutral ceramidase
MHELTSPTARFATSLLIALALSACGDDGASAGVDAGGVTLEHCTYEPVPPTAGAGATVQEAALQAGAAEAIIDIPVSTALGAYTARAGFLGTAGKVDVRRVAISGAFIPSLGVESAPRVKALTLLAGDERVVIVKIDLGLVYEGMVFDVEKRLGPEFQGKVIISASHSHSAWGQQTGSFIFQVGLGTLRNIVYQRYIDTIEAVVNEAVAAERPAKIGIISDFDFDSGDQITRDRRQENDALMGGPRKDNSMFMIRVDGVDDQPIAALPVYGVHGTLMDADNSMASADAPGGAERWLEEQFDSKVVVMHLQGAGGDVSPLGQGSVDCDLPPGKDGDPCLPFLSIEGHGRAAMPTLYAAWQAAGATMQTDIELEMMSRSVETGPHAETFSIRGGTLSYAPFSADREADREIFDANGAIISPIDEFNAPVGAALCEAEVDDPDSAYPLFPAGLMPGTDLLAPYGSCVRLDTAADILGQLLKLEPNGADATHPVCESTRTTVSALRLGDFVLGTVPGELTIMLADTIRKNSPVAEDKTIVLGYAQGHTGYCMTAEDWLSGGYEPSINTWGPLGGEYTGERLSELMALAVTPEREDGSAGGANRVATRVVVDDLPLDEPAQLSGTVPATFPEHVWLRTGTPAAAQPDAEVQRVSGHANFVWIGDDPKSKTPVVTLQRETSTDVFEDVRRRSGRTVRTSDLLLMYTPSPLRRVEGEAQTHYWAAEWQAVPWTGSQEGDQDLDSLDARARVPLGRYRFHVVGNSFDIFSEAFTVTPATLGVAASLAGQLVQADISLHAPKSYRLMDLDAPSNKPVALRSGLFTVELTITGQSPLVFTDVTVDGEGRLSVDAGAQVGQVTAVTVTDADGNVGSATL